MKKIAWIFILTPFLLATTCTHESDDCHKRINFINRSDKAVRITGVFGTDTTGYLGPLSGGNVIIAPGGSDDFVLGMQVCYEIAFPSQTGTGNLMVYVFDNNVIETIPSDTIIKYSMYLKRYDLRLEDLQQLNWTITYP